MHKLNTRTPSIERRNYTFILQLYAGNRFETIGDNCVSVNFPTGGIKSEWNIQFCWFLFFAPFYTHTHFCVIELFSVCLFRFVLFTVNVRLFRLLWNRFGSIISLSLIVFLYILSHCAGFNVYFVVMVSRWIDFGRLFFFSVLLSFLSDGVYSGKSVFKK